jgi:hypothetical protein
MKDKELLRRLDQVKLYVKVASEENMLNENTVKTAILMYFGDIILGVSPVPNKSVTEK